MTDMRVGFAKRRISTCRDDAPSRCLLDESLQDEIGLDYVFDRVSLLTDRRRKRGKAGRTTGVFLDQCKH